MANFNLYFKQLLNYEGGYTDNPSDKGGPTKYGITIYDWMKKGYDKNDDGKIDKEDVKLISEEDAFKIAKSKYWDVIKGDSINSQSIAELIFDWGYMSGPSVPIKKVQRVLGLTVDGVIGPKTMATINIHPPESLFNLIKMSREKFFRDIVDGNPSQKVFLKGWIARNDSFKFKS